MSPAVIARASSIANRGMDSVLTGLGVFALCLFGIFTRPNVDLASVWPANAFMLGMLLRFPTLARPSTWIAGALGFGLADAATGSSLAVNVILNGGNLAAIGAGALLFSRIPSEDRGFRRPLSVLYFLVAVTGASVTAGLVGAVADPILFDGTPMNGFTFWFATEMVNYMAFLPLVLTLPDSLGSERPLRIDRVEWGKAAPMLALVLSAAAGVWIGGPGAVAFPVPALLWCAVTYGRFTTACLSFVFVAWTLLAIRIGLLSIGMESDSRAALLSMRAGVTLVALGPLVVASVMAARNELLDRLRFLADRDSMTGLLNRRSFLEAGARELRAPSRDQETLAIMILDIDHFKSVNDRYGHAAGDRVITAFAQVVSQSVRAGDLVSRIGGEEFAILLPRCSSEEAARVAERINAAFRSTQIDLEDGQTIGATVSIGVHMDRGEHDLDRLMLHADKALYGAKEGGRNRFQMSSDSERAEDQSAEGARDPMVRSRKSR